MVELVEEEAVGEGEEEEEEFCARSNGGEV
jgi:hypothetical protein